MLPLSVMPVKVEQMAEAFRARQAEKHRQGQARGERLRAALPEARRILQDQYRARRVILFGSLATGETHTGSDVDLAVEAMPPEHQFEALADLMALFGAPVDLVRMEQAPSSLVERIEAEGQEL